MKYGVEIHIPFNHDIKHTCQLLMGLLLLSKRNTISLRWHDVPPTQASTSTIAIKIIAREFSTDKVVSIAFDMSDQSNIFDEGMLETCNIYFKRSFYSNDILAITPNYQQIIKPYGMHLPSTTPALTRKVLTRSVYQITKYAPRMPVFVAQQLKKFFNSYHQFVGLPRPTDYTQSPDTAVPPTVFFQTRVWPQEYVGDDDAQAINQSRANLVRALQNNFKEHFIGGILPTDFAKKQFPDCITTHATDTKNYIRLLKSNLIGVYTRGLSHSVALKLPEYIAASLCIVSENIRNQLSSPFTHENNYLEFDDIDTCINNCKKLLNDKELAQKMRQTNWEYYIENIEPENKVLRFLEQAFE